MFAARLPRKPASGAGLSFSAAANTSGTSTFYATSDVGSPALSLSWTISGGTAPYTVKVFVGGVEKYTAYTGSSLSGTTLRNSTNFNATYQGAVTLQVTDSLGATATSGTLLTMLTYYFSGGSLLAYPDRIYDGSSTSTIYWNGYSTNMPVDSGVEWYYIPPGGSSTLFAYGGTSQTTGTFDILGRWYFDSIVKYNGWQLRADSTSVTRS